MATPDDAVVTRLAEVDRPVVFLVFWWLLKEAIEFRLLLSLVLIIPDGP